MSIKRILFIVNPISGHRDKRLFGQEVAACFGSEENAYEIVFTERAGHATQLAAEAVGKYDIVAAVGGDGTLNEVARGLLHSDTAMAVVPCGSGNGLARCLHLPLKTSEAIRLLRYGKVERIDTGTINGKLFLSVAGIGLDAQTAHDFAQDPRRGFIPYAHYATSNYFHLKPETVRITFDGCKTQIFSPMLVTFANSNQYGYNAVIAPHASLQDGLLDTCVLNRPPLPAIPAFVTQLMHGRIDRSRYLTEIQSAHILVERPAAGVVNLDGEPVMMDAVLEVKVLSQSLYVVVP